MFQACCIIIYIFVSLRDNMGPLRVNEVLNSFDNTGNVCKYMLYLTRHCLRNVFECLSEHAYDCVHSGVHFTHSAPWLLSLTHKHTHATSLG